MIYLLVIQLCFCIFNGASMSYSLFSLWSHAIFVYSLDVNMLDKDKGLKQKSSILKY